MKTQIDHPPSSITIRRMRPRIGAEIGGVDLTQPLSDRQRDEIYAALLKYRVVFFRNQDITREQHLAFGRRFGEVENTAPSFEQTDYPDIFVLKSDGKKGIVPAIWHTDNSYAAEPISLSILKSYVIPLLGGDTAFSSSVAAYEGLDDDTKVRIENLRAVHGGTFAKQGKLFRGTMGASPGDPGVDMAALAKAAERAADGGEMPREMTDSIKAMRERMGADVDKPFDPAAMAKMMKGRVSSHEHPVVRILETGERALYVNELLTSHIVGMDRDESDALLRHLYDQFKIPENQIHFQWQVNSIAFWDNRSVQHYAVADYDEPRHMERVTLKGDRPVGPGDAARQTTE